MKQFDILIVDDEKRYAGMLAKRLGLRGFSCDVCYDGGSAITAVAKNTYRLVILDLRLPDIYGTDVLIEIKRRLPETAVIILTGHGTEKDRERCLAHGAHAFMHKPLDIGHLMTVMAQSEKAS